MSVFWQLLDTNCQFIEAAYLAREFAEHIFWMVVQDRMEQQGGPRIVQCARSVGKSWTLCKSPYMRILHDNAGAKTA